MATHVDGTANNRPGTLGRADRLTTALLRDGPTCVWCGRTFGPLVPPTTEHLVPRVKGGPSWTENEVAACSRCNGQRGHATPVDWLAECRRRGWSPDADRVLTGLERLEEAVGRRGGQRRARPYLEGQLRRLRRRNDETTGDVLGGSGPACPRRASPSADGSAGPADAGPGAAPLRDWMRGGSTG